MGDSLKAPYGNYSDCCGGLDFPKMPHLHAEDCPHRNDGTDPLLFREDRAERQQFDMHTDLFGSPLKQIASCLDTWGRMQRGGSYAEQCFIMANECLKAADALARLPAPSGDRTASDKGSSRDPQRQHLCAAPPSGAVTDHGDDQ